MARVLRTAVVAGGVVYPAGTAETKELAEKFPADGRWTGTKPAKAADEDTTTPAKTEQTKTRRSGSRRSSADDA